MQNNFQLIFRPMSWIQIFSWFGPGYRSALYLGIGTSNVRRIYFLQKSAKLQKKNSSFSVVPHTPSPTLFMLALLVTKRSLLSNTIT